MTNKKVKIDNGITLIALIITIVVLLILAVVTVGAIQESKIIAHAKNAASGYNKRKADEESIISGYESLIEEKLPGDGNGGNNPPEGVDPEQEEIVWGFYDWGEDEYGKELFFIGNVEKLELNQDKEVKAYVATFNDDREEYEYDENSKITTVKLSEVTSIFMYYGNIKNLTLGQVAQGKIENIEDSGVKNLTILEGFGNIPSCFCRNENVLESITIGEGVENITSNAFHHCEALKTLVLPSTLISIENHAFYGCKNLNNLILPSKLSSVGNYTFTACTNLTNITIKQAEGSVDLSNSGLTEEQIKNIKWES